MISYVLLSQFQFSLSILILKADSVQLVWNHLLILIKFDVLTLPMLLFVIPMSKLLEIL